MFVDQEENEENPEKKRGFPELDKLYKFATKFQEKLDVVDKQVKMDADVGLPSVQDVAKTDAMVSELKSQMNNIDDEIQLAHTDFKQRGNMTQHIDTLHENFTWITREMRRVSKHMEQQGYEPPTFAAEIPETLDQIFDDGLVPKGPPPTAQEGEDEVQDAADAAASQGQQRLAFPATSQAPQTSVLTAPVSASPHRGRTTPGRQGGLASRRTSTAAAPMETEVTVNFTHVYEDTEPKETDAEKVARLTNFFNATPTTNDTPTADFTARPLETPTEPTPMVPGFMSESDLASAVGSTLSGENSIPLCTSDELASAEDMLQEGKNTVEYVNDQIRGYNKSLRENPEKPLDIGEFSPMREFLTRLGRIKYDMKNGNMGYFPTR